MNPLLHLPGQGCRYWSGGRCLYEERLNPGLEQTFRCTLLRCYEKRLDDFVQQVECFGLPEDEAGRIWRDRIAQSVDNNWECADFLSCEDTSGQTLCGHFRDGLCRLRLPVCIGRCRRFELV